MATEETPAEPEAPADEADVQYQAAFDAASEGPKWVAVALKVLSAEVNIPDGELDGAEFLAARAEAGRLIARIFRGIAPEPVE